MAIYKVTTNQNIFDVALLLYGSIEGIFDLLISNNWLDMETDLTPGMELEYHDYFVVNDGMKSAISDKGLIPANRERHVYLKHPAENLVFLCDIDANEHSASFGVSGSGKMLIDWGDNSDIEGVQLTTAQQVVEHYFDNVTEKRGIKVYGDFQIIKLDTTKLGGALMLMRPMAVDEYTSHSNSHPLQGLFLFDGTVSVDLSGCHIDNLLPIGDMSLQILDLRHVIFADISVLDDYLQYIVDNYGDRRNCTVYLSSEPTEKGMKAIETILGEDAWNEAGNWVFSIKDKIYTRE